MDLNAKKEQFSYAYVKAVAAQLGINYAIDAVDNDSVDIKLSAANLDVGGYIRNPQIDIQLKCTSRDLLDGGILKYPLPIKNYNDLRGEDIANPRYLMVLIVPENPADWIRFNSSDIALSHCCYWYSLRFLPEKKNSSQVVVKIPIAQRVTGDALYELMVLASKREFI